MKLSRGEHLRPDLVAGLTTAIAAVPDCMASAVMAGLNPAQGLYAAMVGTPVAALTSSSVFLLVTTTGAMSLAAGTALGNLPENERLVAAAVLTVLIGVFQILAGVARLGFLTRYISNAVMTGFLTGIAVLIILSQLADLTGLRFEASQKILRPFELVLRSRELEVHTLLTGVATIALVLALERTRLAKISMLAAVVTISLAVRWLGWRSVELVGTSHEIPRALPKLFLFDLGHLPELLAPALAIGIIGLVQGAGVGQSYPNPDGHYPAPSRDFLAQGLANVASGLVHGMPIGGSAGSTAVNVTAGARSRYANVFSGLLLAVAVLAFGPWIEQIPMASLAALLLIAGAGSLRLDRVTTVWKTGRVAGTMMALTFAATLLMPVQEAVFVSVAASFLLTVVREAERVRVMEVVVRAGGLPEERPAPKVLPSHQVTLLLPYGSLFFAAARTLEESLPEPDKAQRAAVILLLRGHDEIGSTFVGVVSRYARTLQANGGKLLLAGVSKTVHAQLAKTGLTALLGEENIFPAGLRLLAPTRQALAAAQEWLGAQSPAPG